MSEGARRHAGKNTGSYFSVIYNKNPIMAAISEQLAAYERDLTATLERLRAGRGKVRVVRRPSRAAATGGAQPPAEAQSRSP